MALRHKKLLVLYFLRNDDGLQNIWFVSFTLPHIGARLRDDGCLVHRKLSMKGGERNV